MARARACGTRVLSNRRRQPLHAPDSVTTLRPASSDDRSVAAAGADRTIADYYCCRVRNYPRIFYTKYPRIFFFFFFGYDTQNAHKYPGFSVKKSAQNSCSLTKKCAHMHEILKFLFFARICMKTFFFSNTHTHEYPYPHFVQKGLKYPKPSVPTGNFKPWQRSLAYASCSRCCSASPASMCRSLLLFIIICEVRTACAPTVTHCCHCCLSP